ncbi:MAG: hypothetical protein M3439_04210 [Chloroflexota bacterium]|nr:hypothetical protein [Chloroflexota bacterium]
MFWIIGYIALVAYAAGLFTWAVAHGREGAAVGILLSTSGLQLAVLETLNAGVGIAIMVVGLLVVGRDIVLTFRRSLNLAPALVRSPGERVDEAA